MPNDAKFGLIVGVAVVIAISVVFFRKEPAPSAPRGREAAAAAVGANSVSAAPTHSLSSPIKGATAEEGQSREP
jgi:hypothetical protein